MDVNRLYDLKRVNRIRIYNMIRNQENISRKELAYKLQLSLPTINQNLCELIEEGYIQESGLVGKSVGRRAVVYSICKEIKLSIGIDITKNHINIACINLKSECIYKKKITCPFERSDSYAQYLGALIDEMIQILELEKTQIEGVGISIPGLIDVSGEKVYYGASLKFTGMTLQEFSKYIDYPCRLYNDADAAGYAEACLGNAISDSFYISLNNSVGGAILINGQIYKGAKAKSGEIGHMTLDPNGPICFCGQRGCFDVYCNAAVLSDCTNKDLGEFFEKLENNNLECKEVWNKYLYYLSVGINNIRMLFDCQIILGGYVGSYLEPYMQELKELVRDKNPFEDEIEYLTICQVRGEASALGAALPFVQNVINNI